MTSGARTNNNVQTQITKILLTSLLTYSSITILPTASYATEFSSISANTNNNIKFVVTKATEAEKLKLNVDSWETWDSGEQKYKNKIYQTNEVCYIDKGKFRITPVVDDATTTTTSTTTISSTTDSNRAVDIQGGDFVTFPKGFKCTWEISERVYKHWKEFD